MELPAVAAGAGIHALPLPTPFAVGRINAYLLDGDPLTLVDTGPNSGKALDELERGLAVLGHRVEDLGLIVLTHQHMDHLGLVEVLVRRSGAEVAALAALAGWARTYRESMEADDAYAEAVMTRHGIPDDVRFALRGVSASFRGWGGAAEVGRELHDGDLLEIGSRALRVLHRPGHSPTDTVFHDEERGLLLGGDHLIGHISSNPLITRPVEGEVSPDPDDRPHALEIYLDSLTATRAMALEVVLPGHGEPVRDHVALIDERVRLHARRADKLARLVAEQPRSAYELAQAMWGNVAVTQAYLTLSEVLGHTDLLVRDGRARAEAGEDDVVRFVAA